MTKDEQRLRHGDRVEEIDTGRKGTYDNPSGGSNWGVVWDDEPDTKEILIELPIRKIEDDDE